MSHLQSYQKSLQERISGSSPEQLMVMLFEGMITRIKQARDRFEAGQKIQGKSSVMRAMRIADALMEHLNVESGGETAKNLEDLYYFVIAELSSASINDEPYQHLDNAVRVLTPLHNAWQGLASNKQAPA